MSVDDGILLADPVTGKLMFDPADGQLLYGAPGTIYEITFSGDYPNGYTGGTFLTPETFQLVDVSGGPGNAFSKIFADTSIPPIFFPPQNQPGWGQFWLLNFDTPPVYDWQVFWEQTIDDNDHWDITELVPLTTNETAVGSYSGNASTPHLSPLPFTMDIALVAP